MRPGRVNNLPLFLPTLRRDRRAYCIALEGFLNCFNESYHDFVIGQSNTTADTDTQTENGMPIPQSPGRGIGEDDLTLDKVFGDLSVVWSFQLPF